LGRTHTISYEEFITDYELGAMLWRVGYIVDAVPIISTKHRGGISTQITRYDAMFEFYELSYTYEYWCRQAKLL